MELIDSFIRPPGCCAVCYTPTSKRGVIDLKLEDPGQLVRRSHVYLCADCALQVATLIVPQHGKAITSNKVTQEMAMVYNELAVAKAEIGKYEEIMRQIRGLEASDVG